MEKFIRESTLKVLQFDNILTNRKFGFIKGSSTTGSIAYKYEQMERDSRKG